MRCLSLIQKGRHFGRADIGKRIIARAAFNIAIGAGDIAERAGIDPKRLERRQRHLRAGFTLGGDAWVAEFQRVKRLHAGGVMIQGLSSPKARWPFRAGLVSFA